MSNLVIDGESLTLDQIAAVVGGARVEGTKGAAVLGRLQKSLDIVSRAIETGEQVYGVTTLFGAMADQYVPPESLVRLQELAIWQHKSATGPRLSPQDVRAAILLRANSLLKGASGIRLEIIERFVTFLNAGVHPQVYQRGSIGASGDLVPLSYIGASLSGLAAGIIVDHFGYSAAFLASGAAACGALGALFGFMPETARAGSKIPLTVGG